MTIYLTVIEDGMGDGSRQPSKSKIVGKSYTSQSVTSFVVNAKTMNYEIAEGLYLQ